MAHVNFTGVQGVLSYFYALGTWAALRLYRTIQLISMDLSASNKFGPTVAMSYSNQMQVADVYPASV